MTRREKRSRRSADPLERLLDAAAPPPLTQETRDRIAARVSARLALRERRARLAGTGAGLLAAAALLAVSIWWRAPAREQAPDSGIAGSAVRPSVEPTREALEPNTPKDRASDAPDPRDGSPSGTRAVARTLEKDQEPKSAVASETDRLADELRSADRAVVRRAMRALARNGADGVAILIAHARAMADLKQRIEIFEALGRSGSRLDEWVPKVLTDVTLAPVLVHWVTRSKPWLESELLRQVRDTEDPRLAATVTRAFLELDRSRGAPLFWSFAHRYRAASPRERDGANDANASPASDLDRYVADSLAGLGEEAGRALAAASVSAASRGARSSSDPARRAILTAIGRSHSAAAWPVIERALHDRAADPAALLAAGALGDARAIPLVRRWVYLDDERGRAAVDALRRIPGVESARALLDALAQLESVPQGASSSVRGAIASALRDRAEDALVVLRRELEASAPSVRAVRRLAELFPDEAPAVLEPVLLEGAPSLRPSICRALVTIGTPEALLVLIRGLEHGEVRSLARDALVELANVDFGPDPRAWRSWHARNYPISPPSASLEPKRRFVAWRSSAEAPAELE